MSNPLSGKRIAVVGAGVFGSWIALTAVRRGFETTLIDRRDPANALSSSSGPTRIIRRAYGAEEIYTLFAHRSLELWTQFFNAENRPECFVRTGALWMAHESDASLHAARAIFERHHILHQFLESPDISALCPGMRLPKGTIALFEPECGALLAEKSVQAVVDAAVREGARYIQGEVERSAEGFAIASEPLVADQFVFASGSWLATLFPDVLADVIRPSRQELFFFEPPHSWPPHHPIWVDQADPRIPWCFPDISGEGIKVGFHRLGPTFDPDFGSRAVGPESIAEAADYLCTRFPSLSRPVLRRASVCHYGNSPSGDFLIDRHPADPRVWLVGGGSGHGFKHGPAVGEYVLDAMARGFSSEPRFRLETAARGLARSVV